jgi:nicotinate-nucleotide--dimethylbenzimidazole phosphoribosyltransferase
MTKENALRSIETGIQMVRDTEMNTDLYAVGEMGIGNTTSASAIISSILDINIKDCTGYGTGIDDKRLAHKVKIIGQALSINKPNMNDPYDVLAKVGGFEIGAMAGMIIGAAHYRRPVLIDGVISTAAALLAYKLAPESKNYMILSHASIEPAHKFAYEHMDLKPLLQLNMRLGEGSGTPLAMNLMEASLKIINEMATFESAGVSGSEQ